MNKQYKKISLLIIFIIINSVFAFAHPHLFISSTQEFVWENKTLKGCWIEWTFDSYFSADIIHGYDYDNNGVFSTQETKDIFENAFINLKNYYYFTFIRQGKQRTTPKEILNFSAKIKNRKLSYRFFIDLSSYKNEEIYLSIYDYTFFCDIDSADPKSTKLTFDSSKIKPKFVIQENKNYPVYYNPLGSIDDTTIYYEWKKGLQTFYPKEIKIFYEK